MEERILKLEQELAEIKSLYYKDNFEAKQIFRKETEFVGTVNVTNKVSFFGEAAASQQTAVTPVGTPSGTYQQSEAQAQVTAINAIITRLQNLGLFA